MKNWQFLTKLRIYLNVKEFQIRENISKRWNILTQAISWTFTKSLTFLNLDQKHYSYSLPNKKCTKNVTHFTSSNPNQLKRPLLPFQFPKYHLCALTNLHCFSVTCIYFKDKELKLKKSFPSKYTTINNSSCLSSISSHMDPFIFP